jgi:transcriptional regulator with XRE-family HTH domain
MPEITAADNPIDPIVAELLRARKTRGLRQQEVADKAGISRRSLVSIESGGDCTLSTLRGLCTALGIEIQATVSVAGRPSTGVRSFATAQAMSDHQEQREVAQALQVQAMSPARRSKWLASNWGALQSQALSFVSDVQDTGVPRVVHFATIKAKNQYDEQRDTAQAVRLALARGVQ